MLLCCRLSEKSDKILLSWFKFAFALVEDDIVGQVITRVSDTS